MKLVYPKVQQKEYVFVLLHEQSLKIVKVKHECGEVREVQTNHNLKKKKQRK